MRRYGYLGQTHTNNDWNIMRCKTCDAVILHNVYTGGYFVDPANNDVVLTIHNGMHAHRPDNHA